MTPLLLTRSDREMDAAAFCHSWPVAGPREGLGQVGQDCLLPAPVNQAGSTSGVSIAGAFGMGKQWHGATCPQRCKVSAVPAGTSLVPALCPAKHQRACRAAVWGGSSDFRHEGGEPWGTELCEAGGKETGAAPGWGQGAPACPHTRDVSQGATRSCCMGERKEELGKRI